MKLAFSTIGCPAYSWVDIYPMAKDLGFDGIEVRAVAGRDFAPTAQPFLPRQRQRTREQLEHIGLEVSCFSSGCTLAGSPDRNDTINELTAYIELASDLGCRYVRALPVKGLAPTGAVDDEAWSSPPWPRSTT